MIAAIRGPYCTGPVHASRRLGAGPRPAQAFAFDEAVLAHLRRDRRDVEQLTSGEAADRPASQALTAVAAGVRFVHHHLVWVGDLPQRRPGMPGLPAGLRPERRRSDFGAGLSNGESVLGGLLEFRES